MTDPAELGSLSGDAFWRLLPDIPVPAAVLTLDFRFARVNPAFEQMLGYTNDELRTMTFLDVTHPATLEASTSLIRSLQTGEVPVLRMEKRCLARGGRDVWAVATIATIRGPEGEPRGLLAMVDDVTERRAQEEALRNSERNYRFLVENLNVGVFRSSPAGQLVQANRAVAEMAGHASVDETLTLPASRLYADPADRERFVAMLRQDGEVRGLEVMSARKDGTAYPISVSAKLMRDAQGEPECILGIVEDLTERRRAADALRRSQQMESLGVLAGGVAHDFNNLLTAVFGYVDLARRAATDDHTRSLLDEALDAHTRAVALTRQLLTFARGGEPSLGVAPVEPMLRSAVRLALAGTNVSCRFEVDPDLPTCRMDTHQISQVVSNLLINARQALPNGGEVQVRARLEAESGGAFVEISVRDAGPGIPADILPRVFDPFFTTKPGGSGLGLAICHSIIARHGGHLALDSAPGKGTTARFRLLAAVAQEPAKPVAALRGRAGSGQVLVMDDEPAVRRLIMIVLQRLGYTPIGTQDGAEALAQLRQAKAEGRPVLAALLDLTVPGGMGGCEVVPEARKIDASVPLIAMSGYNESPVLARPRDFGFDAAMAKPMRLEELESFLIEHLEPLNPEGRRTT